MQLGYNVALTVLHVECEIPCVGSGVAVRLGCRLGSRRLTRRGVHYRSVGRHNEGNFGRMKLLISKLSVDFPFFGFFLAGGPEDEIISKQSVDFSFFGFFLAVDFPFFGFFLACGPEDENGENRSEILIEMSNTDVEIWSLSARICFTTGSSRNQYIGFACSHHTPAPNEEHNSDSGYLIQ